MASPNLDATVQRAAPSAGQLVKTGVRGWLMFPAIIGRVCESYARFAALAIIAIQVGLMLLASITKEMLNADGAFFVFALAAGNPWKLKWMTIPPRVATYVFTVVPTELATLMFGLSGGQIAAANAFFFYGLLLAQFAFVVVLAWRRFPNLLIFPVMQYAFSLALGFGFPSEILIAPGFFWICLFLLLSREFSILLFAICFAGLVFSHEMALFGAALVSYWAWHQRRSNDKQRDGSFVVCGIIFCAWILVRLEFPSEADFAVLSTVDPRRVADNPTLWMMLTVVLSIALWAVYSKSKPKLIGNFCLALICVLLPIALHPWINFGHGRYSSGRTLVGLELPLFGLALIFAHLYSWKIEFIPYRQYRLALALSPVITGALAIGAGASLAFLLDWNVARAAMESYVGQGQSDTPIEAVTLSEASKSLAPSEVKAIDRTEFRWTWPYRSVLLAENYRPKRIIYGPSETFCEDSLVKMKGGSISLETRSELTAIICVPHAAVEPGISGRFVNWIHELCDTMLKR